MQINDGIFLLLQPKKQVVDLNSLTIPKEKFRMMIRGIYF